MSSKPSSTLIKPVKHARKAQKIFLCLLCFFVADSALWRRCGRNRLLTTYSSAPFVTSGNKLIRKQVSCRTARAWMAHLFRAVIKTSQALLPPVLV